MSCLSNFPTVEVLSPEDTPRRRHWSDEDKLRIVEESFEGVRQGSATARRYGVSSGDKISTLGKLLKHDISHALSLIPQIPKTALPEGVLFGCQKHR